jgi:hypothetical protein
MLATVSELGEGQFDCYCCSLPTITPVTNDVFGVKTSNFKQLLQKEVKAVRLIKLGSH